MFINAPPQSAATEKVYAGSAAAMGFVMNLSKAWAWRPEVFDGFAALRNQLTGQSALSKRDMAVMVCATAAELRDSYCSLAWGKTLAQEATPGVAAAVIANAPSDALTARDRALAAWARKVVANPNATTEGDIAALRAVGLGDREIFEATTFIAFRLAFSSINDALGVNPDRQLAAAVPAAVRTAVSFGRAAADV